MVSQEQAVKETLSDGTDLTIWAGQWDTSQLKSFAKAVRRGESNLDLSDLDHLDLQQKEEISRAGGPHVSF